MSAPIFISYSSKDQKIAEAICRALEARGFDCWIAARNVGPGENFQEAIVKALRGARLMLLVFTSNANNSNEIKKEVVLAGRHHVTVVPVRVEDVIPNDALAYEFATRQWIDLFTDWEREIERLVTQIGSILTEGSQPVRAQAGDAAMPEQPMPPPAVERSARRPLAFVLSALLLLGLGGGAYLYLRPVAQPPAPLPAATLPASPQESNAPITATRVESVPASAPSSAAAPPLPAAPAEAVTPEPPSSPPPSPPGADERAWREASNVGTVQAFREYLDRYPDAAHFADARQRIQVADDKAFTIASGAGTMLALNQYLTQFPDGAHVAQAQASVAALEQQANDPNPPALARRFDGSWQIAISCPPLGKADGYTEQFPAQVKDGNLHGQYETEGKPGSLTLDARIQADGSAEIFAHGLTGKSRYAPGAPPPGSPVSYRIQAKFDRTSATGSRVETRPCTFTAFKR
ncbi:MAG TPA: toll/interleukin-1 receptor domain-containing protein [Xanthobacteraceae bacterium]